MKRDSQPVVPAELEARPGRRWPKAFVALAAVGTLAWAANFWRSYNEQLELFLNDAAAPSTGDVFSADHMSPELDVAAVAANHCEDQIAKVRAQPAVRGAPEFERNRLNIMVRTKVEPVVFVRTPEYEEEGVSPTALLLRAKVAASHPFTALKEMRSHFINFHADARHVLLKDGYLWADDPDMAQAIATWVKPRHLFGHDEIWIQRGERVIRAVRNDDGRYVYVDGEHAGQSVQLMPLDRVGSGAPPDRTLHLDVRALKYRLHFSQMRISHVTDGYLVADLKYGKWWVPTLLSSDGARLDPVCEVANLSLSKELERTREQARVRSRALQALRQTILTEIDERLPFDEPKREYGEQLDGKLRKNWLVAYQRSKRLFEFNQDKYAVFDEMGRPHVPQVCVDFLMDTFERTSGTWYRARGEKPMRVTGRLDFSRYEDPDLMRQVSNFIEFSEAKSDWFETYRPPWLKRVKMGVVPAFVQYLQDFADQFQAGDMVLIRGRTPWDPHKMHYHSFIVYESDPLTGMPLYMAGNAGRPTIRAWETEATRTPERYIVFRVRPRTEWLSSIVPDDVEVPEHPLSMGPGRG